MKTASIPVLPELGFETPLAFTNFQHSAPSGSKVDATARVTNRGLTGTHVRIDYFTNGQIESDATQNVYLSPGNSIPLSHAYRIEPGLTEYAVVVSALDSNGVVLQEAFGTSDNRSTVELRGKAELFVDKVEVSDWNLEVNRMVNIQATISNRSNLPVGAFDVAIYVDDLSLPGRELIPRSIQHVNALAASSTIVVQFPWEVPGKGGHFVITTWADVFNSIVEVSDQNNLADTSFRVVTDVALIPYRTNGSVLDPIQLTVVDYTGIKNVRVDAMASNLGYADLSGVKASLFWSLDGGKFVMVEQTLINIPARGRTPIIWHVDGWGGSNRYRVKLESPSAQLESDYSNNLMESKLFLQGLADLKFNSVKLSGGPYQQGKPVTVEVTIENDGMAIAKNIIVEVFARTPIDNAMRLSRIVIDHLNPHTFIKIPISLDTRKLFGSVEFKVVIDRANAILESFETNNSRVLPRVQFARRSANFLLNEEKRDPIARLNSSSAMNGSLEPIRPTQMPRNGIFAPSMAFAAPMTITSIQDGLRVESQQINIGVTESNKHSAMAAPQSKKPTQKTSPTIDPSYQVYRQANPLRQSSKGRNGVKEIDPSLLDRFFEELGTIQ